MGGDHSIAIGTVGGTACAGPFGLIWVDAHGDFNTPDISPSGNIHGMPVAVLTGRGHPKLVNLGHPGPKLRPQDVVMMSNAAGPMTPFPECCAGLGRKGA